MKSKWKLMLIILSLSLMSSSFALLQPRALSNDKRIKWVNYDPNNVVLLQGHLGYQIDLELAPSETVATMVLGDSAAWQVNPIANHVFIKPMADSNTNLSILTNKRSYSFELNTNSHPESLTYQVQFHYPENDFKDSSFQKGATATLGNEATHYNWQYTFVGDKTLAPIQAFDDGNFTYFKFRAHRALPAILSVDQARHESLVNFHREGDYFVVHQVAKQFTFRRGRQVTCIFNEKS